LDYWTVGLLNIVIFGLKNQELSRAWTVGLLNILIFHKKILELFRLGLLDCWTVEKSNISKKILELFRAWTVGLLNILIFQIKKPRAL
jgi:hypothetical protein